jgi:hypothetical protein
VNYRGFLGYEKALRVSEGFYSRLKNKIQLPASYSLAFLLGVGYLGGCRDMGLFEWQYVT